MILVKVKAIPRVRLHPPESPLHGDRKALLYRLLVFLVVSRSVFVNE